MTSTADTRAGCYCAFSRGWRCAHSLDLAACAWASIGGFALANETSASTQQQYGQQQPGNGLAIAGLVCGIVGLLLFDIILGPLAIVFGGIGRTRANRGARYEDMAIAAVLLGIADLVIVAILLAAASKNGGSVYFHVG